MIHLKQDEWNVNTRSLDQDGDAKRALADLLDAALGRIEQNNTI